MSDAKDQLSKAGARGDGRGGLVLDRPRPEPEPPREPEMPEDSGTQALSEALRSSFVIVKVIMVILVAVFLGSGIFTVPSQKKAIILRFGKPVGTGEEMLLEPGLHWSYPYPIDDKIFIPIGQQSVRSTVGWYATTPEQEAAREEPMELPSLNPATDGYTITSDANILHVRATLNYRITDPLNYAMNFVTASNMVQNILDSSIVYASARTKVDDALRLDRIGFQEKVFDRVRQLADAHGLGIAVDPSTVEVIVPTYVKKYFEAVNSADAERRQALDKAQGDANRSLSTAQAEASSIVNGGQIDGTRLVESVRAESRYFLDQLPRFENNPSLFMARLQVETMHRVLTNAEDTGFNGTGRAMRTLLSREPKKPTVQSGNP